MPTHSAGIVLYRPSTSAEAGGTTVEILIVHPGGPFWADKDAHGWSIPKGEFDPSAEQAIDAARREFTEELGQPPPDPPTDRPAIPLPPFSAGRKTIHAVLIAGDFDPGHITSNVVEIEWPPRSGKRLEIPEVDAAQWCRLDEARAKLHKGQAPVVGLVAGALGLPVPP